MIEMSSAKKLPRASLVKVFALLLTLALAALAVKTVNSDNPGGKIDMISFWLSARCLLAGLDPYSCTESPLALETAKSLSYSLNMANPPFNPPLLFPLIAPLALFSFEGASALWLVFSLAVFLWTVLWFEKENASSSDLSERTLNVLVYLSFFPFLVELYFGQISPLILAAFVLYLRFSLQKPAMSFRSGFALSITLIKPHLLHLIYADLFLRAVKQREWRALFGFAVGTALLSILALCLQPEIFSFYRENMTRAPIYMYNPTFGSWIQILSGDFSFWVRCLPAGIPWLLLLLRYACFKSAPERSSDYLVALLPWSLLTSPYGWVTDQVLLVAVIAVLLRLAGRFRAVFCFILIFCHIFALSGLQPSGMHYFVWYPLFVGLLYLIALGLRSPRT